MTLKEMLDAVMLESGMGTETSYSNAARDSVRRLVAMANRSADYLTRCHGWQALRKVATFNLLASQDAYDLPEDFGELVPDTAFADDYVVGVDMRTSPTEWRYIKTNNISTGPRIRARILGDKLEVNKPNDGQVISLEYVSDKAVQGINGDIKGRFSADSDTWLLDDELLIMDTLWRYMRLIGKPEYQEARADAVKRKIEAMGTESGQQTIIPGGGDYPLGVPYTNLWVTD